MPGAKGSGVWTREALGRRVAELEEHHAGEDFVAAVERFAASLEHGERDLLESILLERSGGLERALEQRIDARGWLRRLWDLSDGRPTRRARDDRGRRERRRPGG